MMKNSIRVICSSRYDDDGYIPHKDVTLPQVQLPFFHPPGGNDIKNRQLHFYFLSSKSIQQNQFLHKNRNFSPTRNGNFNYCQWKYCRNTLAFWAGRSDSRLKEDLIAIWDNDTEIDIQNSRVDLRATGPVVYMEKLYKSKFCLCPHGPIGSSRIADSIHFGCVPGKPYMVVENHNFLCSVLFSSIFCQLPPCFINLSISLLQAMPMDMIFFFFWHPENYYSYWKESPDSNRE